ncbi:hypothetical protein B0H65DRAFT_549878 [Neurospora tetraspora]|uniref:Uncharacterized protein n=1 Tax=Neurospora tetraspora TaxID=94610 RepID=A0AAE0JDB1_9PEZI|nr:hypothetical protein B0H65DRAFT_549878 [Neurospora tetraspora]
MPEKKLTPSFMVRRMTAPDPNKKKDEGNNKQQDKKEDQKKDEKKPKLAFRMANEPSRQNGL